MKRDARGRLKAHRESLPVDAIRVGKRFRRDLGNVEALAGSIRDVGLLHPIVVTIDGRLIAGARRLAAVRKLGWTDVPVRVIDVAEVARGEWVENTARKDFTPSEMVAIAHALVAPLRAAAKTRQRNHAGTAPGRPANTRRKFSEVSEEAGRALDQVARFAGVSPPTLSKAAAVVEAAATEPERFGDLAAKMDKSGKVDGVYRELLRRRTWHGRRASLRRSGYTERSSLIRRGHTNKDKTTRHTAAPRHIR